MKQYKVTFVREAVTIMVPEDTTILEAEIHAGLNPDAPCGGKGTCGKCLVAVITGAKKETVKACATKIQEDLTVDTGERDESHRILTTGIEREIAVKPLEQPAGYLAAFDIGTTSIVGYLLDPQNGKELAHESMLNPQSQYGADVINRCNYVLENKSEELKFAVRGALNGLLEKLAADQKITVEEIGQVSVVGNTCMHHLFLGISPATIVVAPYVPARRESLMAKASEYGIHIAEDGMLLVLPNIDGFVGADTVGCLLATDFDHREKVTLMIDIGTNGELVLGNKERMLSCSTAAGPAFEGAKIECGMRGADGAIDHVTLENGQVSYSVIGGGKPKGICGSGLMDAISVMLKLGLIDDTGYLDEDHSPWHLSEDVYLTQKDIREVQLAKGAMAAGVHIMCETMNITTDDIQEVLVAGAFGNYMNSDSACDIGLLPPGLRKRISLIGNAAGEGAKIAILNHEEFLRCDALSKKAKFIELAAVPEFQDTFVDELGFELEGLK